MVQGMQGICGMVICASCYKHLSIFSLKFVFVSIFDVLSGIFAEHVDMDDI